jgi:polysaccharide pyruvyl transferase WcaK-like protein
VGFLGRGNAGDEAMFQCIYEALSSDFDIVAVVDELGARPGFWDWYPYTHCGLAHVGDIHHFMQPMAGLIVGGGGLGIGFGASQVHVAKSVGTPVILAGVDYFNHFEPLNEHFETFSSAYTDYLKLFDYIAVRSKASVENARAEGVKTNYGADWALNLLSDKNSDIQYDPKRVTLVLREHGLDEQGRKRYRDETIRFLGGLRQVGLNPEFLPFSPEDERFLVTLDIADLAPSHIHWWNARRLKQIIACSGLLVSVGRLHPTLFAFSVGVPCLQVRPPVTPPVNKPRAFGKILDMAKECSIPYCLSMDDALSIITVGGWENLHLKAQVAEAKLRLAQMIDDIRALLKS